MSNCVVLVMATLLVAVTSTPLAILQLEKRDSIPIILAKNHHKDVVTVNITSKISIHWKALPTQNGERPSGVRSNDDFNKIKRSRAIKGQKRKKQLGWPNKKWPIGRTLELGVFVDDTVYHNLAFLFEKDDRVSDVILGLVNQIQSIFIQKSLGQTVTIVVTHLQIFKKQPVELKMDGLDVGDALTKFCTYQMKRKFAKGNGTQRLWDMAIYLTGLDLFREDAGHRSTGTMGLSVINGICNPQHSCVIGEFGSVSETGQPYLTSGWTSAYVVAHEMGHNLGMLHDGYGNSCPKDGYLMSSTRSFQGETTWSECSAKYFEELETSCLSEKKLKRKISKDNDHTKFKLVPGQSWDANSQCQLFLKELTAKHDTTAPGICKSLRCVSRKQTGHWYAGPALDGTFCGPGKWCKSGECVSHFDKETRIVEGNWTSWQTEPCRSGCLSNSMGVLRSTRQCNNPRPLNADFCQGDDFKAELCNDKEVCGAVRVDVEDFSSSQCQHFASFRPDVTSIGQQMRFNKWKLWQSCAIFCRLRTGLWYTPRFDFLGDKFVTHFPDGTWCHQDVNGRNYYCLNHECVSNY